MSSPGITITERDGAIGVLPNGKRLYACVGISSKGPLNTPAAYARTQDVIATFGEGPNVEAACLYIDTYSRPCVVVRTGSGVVGTVSAVDSVKAGTSVVTVAASPTPKDDLEIVLTIIKGGTRGTPGVTYTVSLDAGRTPGPETALGAGTSIAIADAGITLELAAGTFVTGDTHAVSTTAPNYTADELATALEALKLTAINWEIVNATGPAEATRIVKLNDKLVSMAAAGKYCVFLTSARIPAIEETEAEYLEDLSEALTGSTKYGAVCAGGCKTISAISGRVQRRPISFAVGALQASVDEHINIADTNLGELPGVVIRDANGNPDEHDEIINPGLDDARFLTLRTQDGAGVYVNRPRLFSAAGSDFRTIPDRRVINLAHVALRSYFKRRLNTRILVNETTGFILEREAREIELGAIAAMRSLLMAAPKASGVNFKLSRTDNILATSTLTGQGFVIPLGNVEFIDLEVSYFNPVNAIAA